MRTPPRSTDETPTPKEDPKEYLLRLLAGRDYSRAKLEMKLRAQGYEKQSIADAIQSLVDEGWFREDAFISARVRAFLSKNYGPMWIKAKLRAERVTASDAAIDEAYDHLGMSQDDQVRELVRKALSSSRTRAQLAKDARHARNRLVQSVVARGHPISMVMRIVAEMLA